MALFDLLSFSPKGRIGDIEILATLEEIHSDTVQLTEHPVEVGAAITDHAFVRPSEVVIRCGWSNSTFGSFLSAISSLFNGQMSASDYVSSVYSQLLSLQQSRIPFDVTTSKRQYSNMILTSLQVTTDAKTSAVLLVQATCRQVLLVETQATTLPSMSDQGNPASTASTEDAGVKQAQAASPMSGGAVDPGDM